VFLAVADRTVLDRCCFSGCLGRLIADKGVSDDDRIECDALVQAVKNRFRLADFRIPPGLSG